jgi:hypothetical protein
LTPVQQAQHFAMRNLMNAGACAGCCACGSSCLAGTRRAEAGKQPA